MRRCNEEDLPPPPSLPFHLLIVAKAPSEASEGEREGRERRPVVCSRRRKRGGGGGGSRTPTGSDLLAG